MYAAVGFSRHTNADVICSPDPSSGIFYWDDEVLRHVGNVKFAGCSTLQEKQLHMVGYLTELGYDLLIAQANNVSGSPGFEPCLGVFG